MRLDAASTVPENSVKPFFTYELTTEALFVRLLSKEVKYFMRFPSVVVHSAREKP